MKKDINKIGKGFSEFKAFISRGNVVDMAVGVIIGTAFGKIVTSLVNDVLMPILGLVLGGLDFSDLSIKFGDSVIKYGSFIQTVVDFLILAFCIFIFVKIFERFRRKKEETESDVSKKSDEVLLLEEIRDILKKKKS